MNQWVNRAVIALAATGFVALVMTRLRLDEIDARGRRDFVIDGAVSLCVGLAVTVLLFAVLQQGFDTRLGDFFNANSQPFAHGRNVVNVILVDFRGLDTLGEIAVVMSAGIAVLALLRRQHKREVPKPKRAPRRKAEVAA